MTWQQHLPERYQDASIDRCPRGLVQSIWSALRDGPRPIYLWGPVGIGKSYAAAIAMAEYRNLGRGGRFWSFEPLTRQINRLRRDGTIEVHDNGRVTFVSEASVMSSIGSTRQCAVVDDIGVRRPSEAQLALLYEIVENAKGAATIFTGNWSIDELMRRKIIDVRIADRLNAGTIIEARGASQRRGVRKVAGA